MRRPAPRNLSEIQHPGPVSLSRRPHVACHAEAVDVNLDDDRPLLEALGDWASQAGFGSAVLDLGGLDLSAFDYVMPDRAVDDRHAAWYSDTKSSNGAALLEAVAILGWKDGSWFAHIHAYWHENGAYHLGHLLPHTLNTCAGSKIKGFGLTGARFVAEPDPETEFTLFRVHEDKQTHCRNTPNALITTLAPFEDLYQSVSHLGETLAGNAYQVYGLGSLAGAEFRKTNPMTDLISEILLRPTAGQDRSHALKLPVRCVDLLGCLHEGDVKPGGAPTLVTCELLLTSLEVL